MKKITLIGLIWIASISAMGQWIELGQEQEADYPFGLCEDNDGNVLVAVASVYVPMEINVALPYLTRVYKFSASSGLLDMIEIPDFLVQSIFNWEGYSFVYGSGQTSTGMYSLEFYRINNDFQVELVYEYSAPNTSSVAREAYVDMEGNLVLFARRFYDNDQDFLTARFSTPGLPDVLTMHSGPENYYRYNFLELESIPDKYYINGSNGMNLFLEKEGLDSLEFFSTQMQPMILFQESTPIVISDSTYLVCGDNFTVDGFGNNSGYMVNRNVNGEVVDWFELQTDLLEITNRGCGFYFDEVNQELYIGITADDDPFNNLVPPAKFGLWRYSVDGLLLASNLYGDIDQFYSNQVMKRLSSGQFVTAGIRSPAGIIPDENDLDVFVAFYDEEGELLTVHTEPLKASIFDVSLVPLNGTNFLLHLGRQTGVVCEIFDVGGKLVYRKQVQDLEIIQPYLDSGGIYLVRLKNTEQILLTTKVIVQ
jgi:hypothetical protein